MALGFGLVAPQDWDDVLKGGRGGDEVDPGQYLGKFNAFRHVEASEKMKGRGVFFGGFELVEGNDPKWVGKKVECSFNYHPNPPAANMEAMNSITLQRMAELATACQVEMVVDSGTGMFNLPATLTAAAVAGPVVKFTVSHRVENGKKYQDVGGFQALV